MPQEVTEKMAADKLEFRFRGGRLCLNSAATYGERYRGGVERLVEPPDLRRWFRLALEPELDIEADPADLERFRELREAIYRLVNPATRERPQSVDVALVNSWANRPDFAPQLAPDGRSATLWSGRAIEAGLSTVARDAIDLLSEPQLDRVRECAFPDCCLLFLDTSRTQQRLWCEMKSCGNRYKVRRHRKAHA